MYHPPLKDFRFLLNQQFQLERLSALPRFAEFTPDLADSILNEAGRFATEILEPLNKVGDRVGARHVDGKVVMPSGFSDAYQRFVGDGWPLLALDAAHGGQGAPLAVTVAAEEMWFSANMAFMLCPQLGRGAVEALLMAGTPELKQRFLPKMTSGEWSGTMNLTEPQAGSDLAAIRTRAQPAGDHYLISGQKIFITYGEHDLAENIVHLVLARIDGAPAGVKGISLFVVPKYLLNADGSSGKPNDLRCVSIEHKLGIHASPTCVMSYGDGGGAVGFLVGEPNRGLEYMFIMMNTARLDVGVQGIGLAEKAFQQAIEWARTRVQGRPVGVRVEGTPTIIQHPDVRRMLMMMKSSVEAARALAILAALQFDLARAESDAGKAAQSLACGELLIPIVKGWCTEQVNDVASLGVQVHGGMGFIEETGIAQTMRDARITAIYEGTTAIQANDLLGRKLLRDNGAALARLLDELTAALQSPAAGSDTADIVAMATQAITELRSSSMQLARHAAESPPDAFAVSVPYLKLCGFVIGAALLARGASIAARESSKPDADQEFLRGKVQTARFYMHHWLPQAMALNSVVRSGGASVTAAEPALI